MGLIKKLFFRLDNLKHKEVIFDTALFICFVLIAGFLSISLELDWDWDVANYHIYNPWALLTGRVGYDIMPASIMTYYNPVLDILTLYIINTFNDFPKLVLFIFGFSYALLLFITFKIAQLVFKTHSHKTLVSLFSTAVGCSALYTVLIVGRQSHDILEAALILCGIYLILNFFEKQTNVFLIALSGFILGAVVGFKYIYAPFAVSAAIVLFFFRKSLNAPYRTMAVFAFSGIAGFLTVNGFWMYKLYTIFNNPIMPQFSEFFPNEWINPKVSVQAADANTYHYVKAGDVWKLPFLIDYDNRFLFIYLIFIINLFVIANVKNKKMQKIYGVNLFYSRFLLFFCVLSIVLLIKFFIELRYSCATAALSGILVIAFISKFSDISLKRIRLKKRLGIITVLSVIVSVYLMLSSDFSHIKFTHRFPLKNRILSVDNANFPDGSVVLVQGGFAFIVPYQNPNVRYIYFPEMRFLFSDIQIFSDRGYEKLRNYMQEQPDKVFFVGGGDEVQDMVVFDELKTHYGVKGISERKLIGTTFGYILVGKLELEENNSL